MRSVSSSRFDCGSIRSTERPEPARRSGRPYPRRMGWRNVPSIAVVLLAAGVSVPGAFAVTEPPPDPIRLGLFEWMAVAPIVVAADVLADDGKYIQAMTRAPIKGAVPEGTVLLVDLKKANRDRAVGVKSLDLAR